MQLWALTYFALVLAAAEPRTETFQTGDWKGRANFNSEGAFTDCTVLLADPEGNLGMIVANSALNMKPGTKKPVIIHMDGLDSFAAMSDVVAETGVLVPLEIDGALVRNIEQDKEFRVTVREKELNLQLSGTREALKTLKTCVETHRGKKRIEL
ncbi:MAG: hypothetical protein PVH66_00495 [Methyloceanibacter sp.]